MMQTNECQTCRAYWCTKCNYTGYRPVTSKPCPKCWRPGTLLSRPVHHRSWIICPAARRAATNGVDVSAR